MRNATREAGMIGAIAGMVAMVLVLASSVLAFLPDAIAFAAVTVVGGIVFGVVAECTRWWLSPDGDEATPGGAH